MQSKSTSSSFISTISQGQSRAHDVLQKYIVAIFYQFCSHDCPLRTDSYATSKDVQVFSEHLYSTGRHNTEPEFNNLWIY